MACNASWSFPTLSGGIRFITNLPVVTPSDVNLELRPLPSTGVNRLRRYYEPLRLPTRPGLSLASVRLGHAPTVWGLPCCVRSPCAGMPSPLPRWDRSWDRFAPLSATTAAFPVAWPGRLPHFAFRGLLSVHSRYSLPARGAAQRPFASKASAISLPPPPLRLLPAGAKVAGWEWHPLKIGAFSRGTKPSAKEMQTKCKQTLTET